MPTDHRAALANIKRFDQLIAYLRDEMGWPIARDSFEDVDDLFYDFTADELASIMCSDLGWNAGLPLAAAGFTTDRYRKAD